MSWQHLYPNSSSQELNMLSERISNQMQDLIDVGFLLGMKVETESEGLPWQEISRLRVIAGIYKVPFFVKIGGVEAISDMAYAANLGVDELIAPMVETQFAALKFLESSLSTAPSVSGRRLLVESVTGVRNLEQILDLAQGRISGVNFGRSDYATSLQLENHVAYDTESTEVSVAISNAIFSARQSGFETTMGGKITHRSVALIGETFEHLPEKLETRRFVFDTQRAISDVLLVQRLLELELALMSAFVATNNSAALKTSLYVGELESRLAVNKRHPFSI